MDVAGQVTSKDARRLRDSARNQNTGPRMHSDDLELLTSVVQQLWNERVRGKLLDAELILRSTKDKPFASDVFLMDEPKLPTVATLATIYETTESVERKLTSKMAVFRKESERIAERCKDDMEAIRVEHNKYMKGLEDKQRQLQKKKDDFLEDRKKSIEKLITDQSSNPDIDSLRDLLREYGEKEREADAIDDDVSKEMTQVASMIIEAPSVLMKKRQEMQKTCSKEQKAILAPLSASRKLIDDARVAKDVVWREVNEAMFTILMASLDDFSETEDESSAAAQALNV